MPPDDPHAHIASIDVAAPADQAYAFMADGMAQTYWALGSWDRRDEGDGLFSGTSLFDGRRLYVRLDGDPARRLVDYRVGHSPDELRHCVQARVMPGEELGLGPDACIVTLVAWRLPEQDAEGWALIHHAFKTEVHLIRARIEGRL
ncbi:MAG TPA: hypothetical protein VIL49_01320 [Capillimicrobium sp.]|jgi:hypothetical protein